MYVCVYIYIYIKFCVYMCVCVCVCIYIYTHIDVYETEEGMATYSRILAWRIPVDRGAWQATVHGVANTWT